ncbi:6-hydroxymethylpterin diphosphokinase MptE-like protein [Mycolicibacterium pulveris]|uniref:6-hydroxymethylpterin diphosphokinase MptE-like protein n=1 Tax=Mycolicibacterium pulveris TaxID=36813 RepID=UPI003CEB3149
MADKQDVIAQEKGRTLSTKRRAATALLGEKRARAVATRLTDIRAWRANTLTKAGRANAAYIRRFKDAHRGARCVIIGNGPSLRDTDLSLLRNEITFGLNRIYLMFDELGFETTFHVVVNQLVVQQCADDFRRIEAPLFTTTPNRAFLDGAANTAYLNVLVGPRFSSDVSHGIWEGATVTYVAMQLAYYMGFSEVILVGVDHRFAVSGPAHQVVESAGPDASHFDPRYFGKGFRWQLPDLETSEVAYNLARAKFEKDGRKIIDATVGGALKVFPKQTLDEALGK